MMAPEEIDSGVGRRPSFSFLHVTTAPSGQCKRVAGGLRLLDDRYKVRTSEHPLHGPNGVDLPSVISSHRVSKTRVVYFWSFRDVGPFKP